MSIGERNAEDDPRFGDGVGATLSQPGRTDIALDAASEPRLTTQGVDTIAGDTSTTATLTLDTPFNSEVDFTGDEDWFAITLQGGQTYDITLTQNGITPLDDPYIDLYNAAGVRIAFNDDGGVWPNSFLKFTVPTTGVYYISAHAWEDGIGGYQLNATVGTPPVLTESIDWGTQLSDGNVSVYFAVTGEIIAGVTAEQDWTLAEQTQVMLALGTYASVANLTFTSAPSSATADFTFVKDTLDGAVGQFGPPGTGVGAGVGVFDPNPTYGWSTIGLARGGYAFTTLLHEIGHGLGLAHPHDNGGESDILQGVLEAAGPGSYGAFDLNQMVYTVMSYNDGWPLGPNGASASLGWGWGGGPSAMDIAVIQAKYGANTSYHTGDDVYVLPINQVPGTYYLTIWDAGGVDEIRFSGSFSAVIDLRAATLQYEIGGSGFVSYSTDTDGGFTIANGVVIEKATGGSGADTITGNDADNVLSGRFGADTLTGGAGSDVLMGGLGNDVLQGGPGRDVASYQDIDAAVTVSLAFTNQQSTGGAGLDTLIGIEELTGSAFGDTLRGSDFNDTLDGGVGADVLFGDLGADLLIGGPDISVDTWRDLVTYAESPIGVYVSLQENRGVYGFADGDSYSSIEMVQGSPYADVLVGGIAAAAELSGGTGDDQLYADGNDIAIGGAGYDTVFALGGAGLSLNLASTEIERAFGVHGANDSLDASGAFWDVTLWGQGGADVLKGGSANDYIYFDEADLSGGQVLGGAGYDWALNYTSGPLSPMLNVNMAALGIEGYYGSGGSETVSAAGIATSVTIYANLGADQITGGSGDDYLFYTHETAAIQGGAGYDFAIFNENGIGTTLNLATSGIEGAVGRNGADVLNAAACTVSVSLYGNDGADQLLGGSGGDYLYFDEADVATGVLAGGAGYDYLLNYTFTTPSPLLTVNMAALGAEGYQGNAGAERVDASGCLTSVSLYGEGGADQLIGGAGDDYIYFDLADLGAGGQLAGGAGYDYAIYNVASGNAVLELASRGFEGAVGRGGNDSFDGSGSSVSVSLYGYGGADTLIGGSATDYLYGDVANDTLTGGAARDYFVTYAGWGSDTITDFENGLDRVILSAAGPASFAQLILSQDGADAVASYNGNSIRFLDTLVAELDASDFLF